MQKPSVGRIVHVLIDPTMNNGSDVAPAIITRVWPSGGPVDATGFVGYINVRVLADSDNTLWLGSINLFAERPSLDELHALFPGQPDKGDGIGRGVVAFWPPRTE